MSTNGTSLEKRQSPQLTLKQELERIKPALAAVLPKHVTPDRILKVVLSATARNGDLLECTTASIVRAVMQAGELGLEIGGLLGEAYLVPFNVKVKSEGREHWEKQATCIPGYKGLIKLARQSGEISSVSARLVYEGDEFTVDLADSTIHHVPDYDSERSDDKIRCAYCVVKFKDGDRQFDVMTRRELDAVRNRSKSGKSGPWVTDYAEMCRKTVTKRTLKYAPISAERLNAALDTDTANDPIEDVPQLPTVSVVDKLAARAASSTATNDTTASEPCLYCKEPVGADAEDCEDGEGVMHKKHPACTAFGKGE